MCVLHTLTQRCLSMPCHASPRHTLCTLHAHLMYTHAQLSFFFFFFFLHFNDIYMFYHLKHVHLTLLCSVLSVALLFWTNLTLIKFLLLFCVFPLVFSCFVIMCVEVSIQEVNYERRQQQRKRACD